MTKINECLLKDIAGTATPIISQNNNNFWIHLTSNLSVPFEEESKENFLEQYNFNYIFSILNESLQNVYNNIDEDDQGVMFSTINSKQNKILGLKRYKHLI